MINPQWLELPMSRTNFHGSKVVRAIEVRLHIMAHYSFVNCRKAFLPPTTSIRSWRAVQEIWIWQMNARRQRIFMTTRKQSRNAVIRTGVTTVRIVLGQ